MGLDTSHDCWHGSYGSFDRWRTAVCLAGGYGKYDSFLDAYSDSDEPDIANSDPLLGLLFHSDCDGEIATEHTLPLAVRLEEIAPLLREDGEGHIRSYREATMQFARGLRRAHKARAKSDVSMSQPISDA